MIKRYDSWEHASHNFTKAEFPKVLRSRQFATDADRFCYRITAHEEYYTIQLDYFIGVDWLVENHSSIIVAPKLDSRLAEIKLQKLQDRQIELEDTPVGHESAGVSVTIDYFRMLEQCLQTDFLYREIEGLVHIDWQAKEIPITQSEDWLSPLLIVKFLNVLKSIVRKGLKKSYYTITQNLRGRIKGKILVGPNVKQNLLRNRVTHTVCQFQQFGVDNVENRLLHKAFQFASAYIDNYEKVFGKTAASFTDLLNYCRPAFTSVSDDVSETDMKHYKPNPFFKEYTEGVRLAKLILKRYSYTISNTTKDIVTTPPYWIDMPRLFELYVYHFLKRKFPKKGAVTYHLSTYGNELDFLINEDKLKMVVDAKYKPVYIYGKNHDDIRQVAGYARLDRVYKELNLDDKSNESIDCLIIFPDVEKGLGEDIFEQTDLKCQPISGYRGVYKIGIRPPLST